MLGRRSFLISCGWMVAGVATAKAGVPKTPPIVTSPKPMEANETPAIALRIRGWDTPSDSGESADGSVWINIGQSWRTAWR